jgi:hypothetical protein
MAALRTRLRRADPGPAQGRLVSHELVDVARLAGVSAGTVSNVLNRPSAVPEATRHGVNDAVTQLGHVRGGADPRGSVPRRPVRGRDPSDRANACWLPLAKGLTPHGLRHGSKTTGGPRRRLRTGSLLAHHDRDATAVAGRPDRAVGGHTPCSHGRVARLAGAALDEPVAGALTTLATCPPAGFSPERPVE